MQFTIPGPENVYYFMGPALKKPIVHVFLQGFLDSPTTISLLNAGASFPQVCTSQQFFQQVLERAGVVPVGAIPFRIVDFQASLHQQLVSVNLGEVEGTSFEVTSQKVNKPRKPGNLPFGLKRPKRPRRVSGTKRARNGASGQGAAASAENNPDAGVAAGPHLAVDGPDPDLSSDSDSSDASSPTSEPERQLRPESWPPVLHLLATACCQIHMSHEP